MHPSQVIDGRRVIALDGKTVQGARTRPDDKAPHPVAALGHTSGTTLGQISIDAKRNEIPSVRDLLTRFDLTGAVITFDAMHTQNDTATAITGAGGDHVFTVKGNTPPCASSARPCPEKTCPRSWAPIPAMANA